MPDADEGRILQARSKQQNVEYRIELGRGVKTHVCHPKREAAGPRPLARRFWPDETLIAPARKNGGDPAAVQPLLDH